MKKTFIPVLVLLIIFSLVGLIAIQIYWIGNSVALREAQFTRNVKMALREVNNTLERSEAKERMMKNAVGQRILDRIDSLQQRHPRDITAAASPFPMNDTTLRYGKNGNYSLKYSRNSKQTELYDTLIVAPTKIPIYEESLTEIDPRVIAELLTGLINIELGSDFLHLYSTAQIDSLLSRSLHEVGGIETPYKFAIFDAMDRPDMLSEEGDEYMAELRNSPYTIRMFPHDFGQPPKYLSVWFPSRDTYLIKTLWPLLTSSALFMLVIIMAFIYSIRTILQQKKISEIKNDFINNMTHELKTPISTISLACEALSDPVMLSSSQRVGNYVSMISDENKRLGVLVENVLRSAVLDRSEMEFAREPVDLHEVIRTAKRNTGIQISRRNGRLDLRLDATDPVVIGDKIHLTNVVYNLIDNAIKYSKEAPEIQIKSENTPTGIRIAVIDHGIGIKKDDRLRIFDKLYRVPTGNIHDIKGFGLGLSYVKTVMEKHGGGVSVESVFGKGSTFIIEIPNNH